MIPGGDRVSSPVGSNSRSHQTVKQHVEGSVMFFLNCVVEISRRSSKEGPSGQGRPARGPLHGREALGRVQANGLCGGHWQLGGFIASNTPCHGLHDSASVAFLTEHTLVGKPILDTPPHCYLPLLEPRIFSHLTLAGCSQGSTHDLSCTNQMHGLWILTVKLLLKYRGQLAIRWAPSVVVVCKPDGSYSMALGVRLGRWDLWRCVGSMPFSMPSSQALHCSESSW